MKRDIHIKKVGAEASLCGVTDGQNLLPEKFHVDLLWAFCEKCLAILEPPVPYDSEDVP